MKGMKFPGMGGMGNMQGMLQKVQKMQAEMQRVQAELQARTFESTSGGGAVKVTVTGKKEITGVVIDPQVVDPEDVEMLQDMVVAAVNEAMRMAEAEASANVSKLTGGLNLGDLGGLL